MPALASLRWGYRCCYVTSDPAWLLVLERYGPRNTVHQQNKAGEASWVVSYTNNPVFILPLLYFFRVPLCPSESVTNARRQCSTFVLGTRSTAAVRRAANNGCLGLFFMIVVCNCRGRLDLGFEIWDSQDSNNKMWCFARPARLVG